MRVITVSLITLLVCSAAMAQKCPATKGPRAGEPPGTSTLRGTVTMYTLPQKWLGVKLDAPVCDEQNLQLIFNDGDQFRQVKALIGCKVTVTGELYKGVSGEYWTKLAVDDAEVKSDASCKPAPVEPDPMKVPIPETLKSYTVSMSANTVYDSDFQVRIWTEDEKGRIVHLEPWLKYLNYGVITLGAEFLSVQCADGFVEKHFLENGTAISAVPDDDRWKWPNHKTLALKENVKEVVEFRCERE